MVSVEGKKDVLELVELKSSLFHQFPPISCHAGISLTPPLLPIIIALLDPLMISIRTSGGEDTYDHHAQLDLL